MCEQVISTDEAEDGRSCSYGWDLADFARENETPVLTIDARMVGNAARYINHAMEGESANLEAVPVLTKELGMDNARLYRRADPEHEYTNIRIYEYANI